MCCRRRHRGRVESLVEVLSLSATYSNSDVRHRRERPTRFRNSQNDRLWWGRSARMLTSYFKNVQEERGLFPLPSTAFPLALLITPDQNLIYTWFTAGSRRVHTGPRGFPPDLQPLYT